MAYGSYGKDESLTFKGTVMAQYNRVIMMANVEFRGGFYTSVTDKDGGTKEIYVPDTREEFCNGCEMLGLTAFPKFDKKMNKHWPVFIEKRDKLINKFLEDSSIEEETVLGEAFYDKIGDKILLEIYKNKLLRLHLTLFQEISGLFSRENYFSEEGGIFGDDDDDDDDDAPYEEVVTQ
mgnify:CR=1 FL=1